MRKLLLSVSCILLYNTCIVSQTPNLQWAKKLGEITYDQSGVSVGLDGSGNVYSVGNFNYGIDVDPSASVNTIYAVGGSTDIYISKLNTMGNFVWGKSIGGTGTENATDIAVDNGGNTYISGTFENTVDFDPSASTYTLTATGTTPDNFILKLDPSGNFVWAKAFGDANYDNNNSIALDNSGNVYLTGYFHSLIDFDPSSVSTYTMYSYPYTSSYILKLDNAGNFVWAKKFGEGGNDGSGNGICTDANGKIYVTGFFYGTADFDPSATVFNLTANSFTRDAYIAKFDGLGNLNWAKNIGGGYFDEGTSCAIDNKGNVYSTGYYSGNSDFDPSSTATYTLSAGNSENSIFISKLDSLGNFVWANKIGGSYDDRGSSITTDASNNVYIAGYYEYISDFDPSATSTYSLTSNGAQDGFITKLDENGIFVWNASFGAIATDRVNSIITDASNNVYATGFYERNTDFDPSSNVFNLSGNTGNTDGFVIKLNSLTTSINEKEKKSLPFTIYPNPAKDKLNIELVSNSKESTTVSITNILGEEILNTIELLNDFSLNTTNLKSGIYFVTITRNGNQSTQKIIIE